MHEHAPAGPLVRRGHRRAHRRPAIALPPPAFGHDGLTAKRGETTMARPGHPGADELAELRRRLVELVRERGGAVTAEVAEALRSVPRHTFLPGTPPEAVYDDQPIVTKRDAEGRPVSSS